MFPALSVAQPPYTISTYAGSCTLSSTVTACPPGGFSGDGGSATAATLNGPLKVAFDSAGNLYIADSNNNRIREVTSSGAISTVVGNGTAGFTGDNGSAISAELNHPAGIVFDGSNNMFFADADNYEVRKVSGGNITTFAGKNSGGASFSGDHTPATSASLYTPTGVAVDGAGNVYIADPQNNIVRVVCANQTPLACGTSAAGFPPGGTYTFAAGDINTFAGQEPVGAGYQGDGGPSTSSLLNSPNDVALDAQGNLYIADTGNNVIRKVDPNGTITTFAGNGAPGYAGDGGPALHAELQDPKGVAVDADGNVYIADHTNSAIRMVSAATGIITTIAGNGTFGYSGDGVTGGAANAQLNFPSGVAVNGKNIYIADNANNLIRVLAPAPAVPQINVGGVINDASYTAPVAPGGIAAVFGTFYLATPSASTGLPLENSLQGLSFDFGSNTSVPLYYVSSGQVNVQIPWEVTGTSATLKATLNGQTGTGQTVQIAPVAPAIFTLNSQGTGAGAILDSNYKLISSSNPAVSGSTFILIYCTGLGTVSANQPATGAAASSDPNKLAPTAQPVTVTIGGVTENADFAGLAPGYVGLYQVNAAVPAGIASGSAVEVSITIGGKTSNKVTIVVQ